jgi:chromosome segregation ATPase
MVEVKENLKEGLQDQIVQLNQQISTLNHAIEQLMSIIKTLGTERQPISYQGSHSRSDNAELVGHSFAYSQRHNSYHEMLSDSKDILADGDNFTAGLPSTEKVMSPELQIQRLTAQLTAAYNRIAALEEQLLSRRMS